MLKKCECSIYRRRAKTCRDYDCRIFAAAGIAAGGVDKNEINQRVRAWEFQYAHEESRNSHNAIKAAARFIQQHRTSFPGGRIPTVASDLAILAIKVHTVFLDGKTGGQKPERVAQSVIEASRSFDEKLHPKITP